jgi:hypothetical protein
LRARDHEAPVFSRTTAATVGAGDFINWAPAFAGVTASLPR